MLSKTKIKEIKKKKTEAAPKANGVQKNGVSTEPALFRLDLGCGHRKREGFLGVDIRQFDGKVDIIADLTKKWPWADNSVDEVHCSQFIEHLTWPQRVHFFNELYRVMKKDAKALVIVPHWASARFYGDPTHKEPFSEWGWLYLDKEWRKENAPHVDYTCDFTHTYNYGLHPAMAGWNPERVNYAISYYKEVCTDMICTLVKRVTPNKD